jgi:hypothetical protein
LSEPGGANRRHQFQQPGVPFLAHRFRHLVGHRRRQCVAPRRVLEHERKLELPLPHQVEGFGKIHLRLAGKAHNDVGAEAKIRPRGAKLVHQFEEPLPGITAAHQFENPVAAALNGQVRALAELGQPRVGRHQIGTVAFRMGRREPEALEAGQFVHRFEQLHERRPPVAVRDRPPAIAGDNLAEQRDLPHAALHEPTAFGDDVLNGPAALLAARLGYDAERAMLVAALHDADERLHRWPAAVQRQQMVPDVRFTARLGRRVAHRRRAPGQQVVHVVRGAMQFLRAEHQLDPAPEQLAGAALSHATQVAQHDLAFLFAGLGRQLRHPPDRLSLGGVAHAARVE